MQPYGVDAYKGRPRSLGALRQRGIHRGLSGRPRALDVGGRVRQHAPHSAAQERPQDIDESTDTYDTIDWLIKNIPNHNGRVGMWGISYPGFYTAAGMIDAHPGAEGGLAPGARDRLVHRRRLAPQRRLLPAARLQFPRQSSAIRGPSRPRSNTSASSTARPTATRSSSAWDRSPTPTGSISRMTCRSGTRSCSMARSTSSGRSATFAST